VWLQSRLEAETGPGKPALGYPADDEPVPIAAGEKPQDMIHEVLHTLSDANLLIRFHAQRNSLAVGVQRRLL
jgi:hypothetical protein